MAELKDRPATLVIIGAGASHGCSLKESERDYIMTPPVTNELVRALTAAGGGCIDILGALRNRQRTDGEGFEQNLREIYGQMGSNRDRQFSEFRVALCTVMNDFQIKVEGPDSLFNDLFSGFLVGPHRENREWLVLNMNYDTLAMQALGNRSRFKCWKDYRGTVDRPISLFHPHGSVLWEYLDRHKMKEPGYKSAMHEDLLAIGRDGSAIVHLDGKAKRNMDPALAIPMVGDVEGKVTWPTEQSSYFKERLGKVDQVIVVGWRAADAHILEMLRAGIDAVEIVHVATLVENEGHEICDRLTGDAGIVARQTEVITGGFQGYLGSGSKFHDLYPPS